MVALQWGTTIGYDVLVFDKQIGVAIGSASAPDAARLQCRRSSNTAPSKFRVPTPNVYSTRIWKTAQGRLRPIASGGSRPEGVGRERLLPGGDTLAIYWKMSDTVTNSRLR